MQNKNISPEEVSQHVNKLFQSIDTQRAAELTSAKTLVTINNQSLSAEQTRLSAKYGQNDPRVKKLTAQVSNQQNMSPGLDAEIIRSTTKSPGFNAGTQCLIQGTVYDASRAPMKNITVFIATQNNQLLSPASFACSNADGLYGITLTRELVAMVNKDECILEASDKKKNVIYKDTTKLKVAIGTAYYRDIYISDPACTPPSPAEHNENNAG